MVKSNREDLYDPRMWSALAAEYMGTLLLVLVACGSCCVPGATLTTISLCFGLSVATIVWVTCRLSGGHINPGVTAGFLVARRITVTRALFYLVAQAAGALSGAAILTQLLPAELVGNLGTPAPADGVTNTQALGVELVITYVLVLAVFACCDGGRDDLEGSKPLTIGLAVTMCHLFAVPLTGSGMNPARVLGPAVLSESWTAHWVYWAGPLLGGSAAGLTYELLFASNATVSKLKGFWTSNYDNDHYDSHGAKYDREDIKMTQLDNS